VSRTTVCEPQSQSQSHITTDSQTVSMSWCRAQSGTFDQRFGEPDSYSEDLGFEARPGD
jgi:hypothetical protein